MKDIFNFILFLFFTLLVLYQCNGDKKSSPLHVYIREDSIMRSNIGRKFLYEKDSVTIVDYSYWNDTYTISNGVKVNKNLIKGL